MRKNKERLLDSFSLIDESFIKEAEPKRENSGIKKKKATRIWRNVKIAASLAVIIAIGLFLFLPIPRAISDVSAYASSPYYPLIQKIDEYNTELNQPKYANNFEFIADNFWSIVTFPFLLLGGAQDMAPDMMAPGEMNPGGLGNITAPNNNSQLGNGNNIPSGGSQSTSPIPPNGIYHETTDNQVDGVIEGDLVKRTNKYIFRLSSYNNYLYLTVYSIKHFQSELVSDYKIPFSYSSYYSKSEMYLSTDAETVTIVSDRGSQLEIISIDVSDIENINTIATVTIDGSYYTSRLIDGRLLIVSNYNYSAHNVNYDDPKTFVPSITRNGSSSLVSIDDIALPEEMNGTRYSVVTLLSENQLEILGVKALLNFTNSVYISKNNIYLCNEYNLTEDTGGGTKSIAMTDIAVLNYTEDVLADAGVITVRGSLKDQYSLDELEGYLRVVTSTSEALVQKTGLTSGLISGFASAKTTKNVSLYVFKLSDGSLVASVESFAPEGEEATSVRFEGKKLYVCTAEIITFTDPVYFFDLSDYSNITYTDTGIISGFSSSLVDMGEGFLLGIGSLDWQTDKVEIYQEVDGQVTSVAFYEFMGDHAENYKSYYINRKENIFGFGVDNYLSDNNDLHGYSQRYILLKFDGYNLIELASVDMGYETAYDVRGYVIDNFLYVVTDESLTVRSLTTQESLTITTQR